MASLPRVYEPAISHAQVIWLDLEASPRRECPMKAHELSKARVIIVAILLLATAALLQARGRVETMPAFNDLETLPYTVAEWHGVAQRLEPDVLEVLGNGHFLSRLYTSPNAAPVDLFIAYYSTQRSGDTIHSPKNCLPGSGWTPLESDRVLVPIAP